MSGTGVSILTTPTDVETPNKELITNTLSHHQSKDFQITAEKTNLIQAKKSASNNILNGMYYQ